MRKIATRFRHLNLYQIILSILILTASNKIWAQIPASSYGFTALSGTYSEITSGGTSITDILNDDVLSSTKPIGFSFNFCGINYSYYKISSNGYLTFDTTKTSYTLDNSTYSNVTTYIKPGLMFLFDDLSGYASTGTPAATYIVTGTAPNQVLTIQLKNWRWNYSSSLTPQINIQIKLYQTTNVIEYIYSPVSGTTPNNPSATIGIVDGQTTATYQTLNNTSTAPTASSSTYTFDLSSAPANGQIYRWTPPAPCSGQISTGTVSMIDSTCPNIDFTLSTINYPIVSGATVQWQSSNTATGPWTNISGATSFVSTLTGGISSAKYFRLYAYCAASGTSDTSAAHLVTIKSAMDCYCTPTNTSTSYYTTGFSTTGGVQNITSTNSSTSGYINKTTTDTVSQYQNNNITYTLTVSSIYGNRYAIWVDWNQNGSFSDPGDSVYYGLGTTTPPVGTTLSGTIHVPVNATPGATRMRVRNSYYYTYTYPSVYVPSICDNQYYGTAIDYTFKVLAQTPCSATPSGTATISSTLTCPSDSVLLDVTGSVNFTNGITYQWQVTDSGLNNWTNLGVAQTTPPKYAGPYTTAKQYRCIITCINSNLNYTTNVLNHSIEPFFNCFCTPTATYATSYYITGVSTTYGLQNISNTSTSSGAYNDYTTVDTVKHYQNNMFYYTVNLSSNSANRVAIWIDWNHNGSFADPGDTILYTASSTSTPATSTVSGSVLIPANATPGVTRMRVRNEYYYTSTSYLLLSCGLQYYGEAEDYTVNVLAQTPCSSAPSGTATISSNTICPASTDSVILSVTGSALATSGISYQWQIADSGQTNWTNLGNAQSYPNKKVAGYTSAKLFRCIMNCSAGGSTTTNVVNLSMTPFFYCYCTPTATYYTSYYLTDVTTNGGVHNFSNTGTSSSYYSDYTATDTVSQYQNGTFNYNLTANSVYGARFGVWIDWNHNGSFADAGDTVYFGASSTTAPSLNYMSGTVHIPANATPGYTRMRVRNEYYYTSTSYLLMACGLQYGGEAEDYTLNVLAQTACSGTPSGTATISNIYVCPSDSVVLDVTGSSNTNYGITYQWQVSDSGTNAWSNLGVAQSYPYKKFAGYTTTKQFRCILTCTNSSQSYTTNVLTFYVNNFYNCYCIPNNQYGTLYYITNFVTTGGLINTSNASSSSVYSDYTGSDTVGGVRGMVIPYSITKYNAGTRYAMYADWNQNGSFTDPGDTVHYDVVGTNPNAITVTGNITIPINAKLGHTRLRIRSSYYTNSTSYTTAPCGNSTATYGETEDYDFYVMPCPITDTIHSSFVSICPGGSVTLNATTNTDTASFTWNTGATGNSITTNTAGTYIATATSALCAVSDTFVLNQGVQDSLYITPDSPTICGGYPAIIKAHSSYPNAQFTWNTGEATDSLIVGTAATYTVTTTIAGQAGCGNEASIEVTSSPSPFAEIILVTNAGNNNPLEINAHALHVTNTNTYVWNFGDGTVETNTDSVVNHTYSMAGHYTISLAIVNECDTSFLTRDFDLDMSTGVNDIDITNQDVNLFPNPATEEVNIVNKLDNSKMKHITIFNALGQVIYSKDANSANRHQLNINSFASGIYSVRIDLDKGVAIRKLQITK